MNSPIYTDSPDVREIARAAFPSYSGRTFKVAAFSPKRLDSHWDGGSRDYFVLIGLASRKAMEVPQNGTAFDGGALMLSALPEGAALVKHTIFCGKDLGITVYVNPSNLAPLLPPAVELTRAEKITLIITRSLKSFAREEEALRFISKQEFIDARNSLAAKGLLDKRGAITNEGRNAIGSLSVYDPSLRN